MQYFPFGETWVDESTNSQRVPYLFTSKEQDQETGLYYFGPRYYDARTSVWISADPALGRFMPGVKEMHQAQKEGRTYRPDKSLPGLGGVFRSGNLGLYGYSLNNPVRYVDPDGNHPKNTKIAEKNITQTRLTLGKADPKKVEGRIVIAAITVALGTKKSLSSAKNLVGDGEMAKIYRRDGLRKLAKMGVKAFIPKIQKFIAGQVVGQFTTGPLFSLLQNLGNPFGVIGEGSSQVGTAIGLNELVDSVLGSQSSESLKNMLGEADGFYRAVCPGQACGKGM